MIFTRIVTRLKWIYRKIYTAPPLRYCPVCNTNLNEKFAPLDPKYATLQKQYGYPYELSDGETLNALEFKCRVCGATDRDRLFATYIQKKVKPDITYKLLDIAPSVALTRFLKAKKNIHYRSADLMMEGVDDHIDIEDMSIYGNDSFDIFICSHVLEHVNDDGLAMKELKRVLKPEGWGIIMVPIALNLLETDEDVCITDAAERWKRFGQDDHLRLYSKFGFVQKLQNVGFLVEQLGIEYFGKKAFKCRGIEKKSVLYIVKK